MTSRMKRKSNKSSGGGMPDFFEYIVSSENFLNFFHSLVHLLGLVDESVCPLLKLSDTSNLHPI